MHHPTDLPDDLQALLAERFARLGRAWPPTPQDAALARTLLGSDFAFDLLQRHPDWLAGDLAQSPDASALDGLADNPPGAAARLRRVRQRGSLALLHRDLNGLDTVDDTLLGSARLADACIEAALRVAEAESAARHGVLRDPQGRPQRLVVLGLGKLGGSELNFSSDVDLVLAYAGAALSDGARPVEHDPGYVRIAQRMTQLLSEVDADGFAYRVDLRLRPFGGVGRLALSFTAMEQYFQREGRDWERYAWIKARPVAGDLAAGEALLDGLRPFVYRRYLDYTAFAGLRDMKALIEAEVARRELEDHIKLGPGGIREIEFIVQLLQLIRGGREPELRVRGLLPALAALDARGHLQPAVVEALRAAYRFLRRLENRLQMLQDAQTHTLPNDPQQRARIAAGLGLRDWDAVADTLAAHRARVSETFHSLLATRRRAEAQPDALALYWRGLPAQGDAATLAAAGFEPAEDAHAALKAFAASGGVQALSARARDRLDHVLPHLLKAAAGRDDPGVTLERLLTLLHAVLRRSSYLALLQEQPAARDRLVQVFSRSALLAERICSHPLLLDELLDTRGDGAQADRAALEQEAARALQPDAGGPPDLESALQQLNELRQAVAFRLGLEALGEHAPPRAVASSLTDLADVLVGALLHLAEADLVRQHGRLSGPGLLVLGYGSLGGHELGFGSDLDLVLLFDPEASAGDSDGARPIDATRYLLRQSQKLVALLGAPTSAGRLYDVDLRLRPDGAKGLLVSSLSSYASYQHERAWTWEHQALVRARVVAGDAALAERFEAVRAAVLARPREPAAVRQDVSAMRQRMRAELDRSSAARIDLKQGAGGLVDLEFLLQARVLQHAARHPALLQPRDTGGLLDAADQTGLLPATQAAALRTAHAELLRRSLACSLDARPRIVPRDDALVQICATVSEACAAAGLDFAPPPRTSD